LATLFSDSNPHYFYRKQQVPKIEIVLNDIAWNAEWLMKSGYAGIACSLVIALLNQSCATMKTPFVGEMIVRITC
jgi:hypothetical protein